MITATLDRQTKDWALLCCSDGRVYDVTGDNWSELVACAKDTIDMLGENIEIECYNSELPEDC